MHNIRHFTSYGTRIASLLANAIKVAPVCSSMRARLCMCWSVVDAPQGEMAFDCVGPLSACVHPTGAM